ncbi:MAG: filamentous hemagglutinin N-terminal domain-containing protein [Gammaproteobacteria bacterium]|nr:filamentous hemagglutinin N-terminal domain-containing protein [Gammaproteobacteria bacterium]
MSFPWTIKKNTKTVRKRDARIATWRLRRRQSLKWCVCQAVSGAALFALGWPAAAGPLDGMVKGGGPWNGAKDPVKLLDTRTMFIEQTQQKATLNWTRLNIEAGERLHFEQQSSNWVALNRIHDVAPSRIHGAIDARGQVYLINQNGIIFGSSAQIDTHSFVASTHNISDKVFNTSGIAGAINDQHSAAFDAHADGWNMSPDGFIRIDAGATLRSAEGGKIMMFAPRVDNHGDISTPGGQAILAASHDKIYLANSDDPHLRGLLVEVNTGGDVSNWGKIIAERGNVSMIGFIVNQNGVARATTAINVNGSIRLVARDAVSFVDAKTEATKKDQIPLATKTGTLTLGENSLTEVSADNLTATAVDSQEQLLSRIELMGNQITLKTNAHVVAPAGNVQITAAKDPGKPGPTKTNETQPVTDGQFVMQAGSSIDVSGLRSAVLPMERNVVAVELRGTQLADSPLQHNGPLYKETVYIDTRRYGVNSDGSTWQGTPLANVSGEIAKIERPLAERLSTGGKVSIVADGVVALNKDSRIDVSGGAIRYRDGSVNTTQLISQGRLYDIADADPNRPYQGIFGSYKLAHKKWGVTEVFNTFGVGGLMRFESGYVEGKDAGSVSINGRDLPIQGVIRSDVIAGRYQRFAPSTDDSGFKRRYDQAPLGGELVLGAAEYSGVNEFSSSTLADLATVGINRVRVYANNKITLDAGTNVTLTPGGELTLASNGYVDIEGNITAPGGHVQIKAQGETATLNGLAAKLGERASIDVSGQWVNDGVALNPGAAPATPVFIDGGAVTLAAAGNMTLEKGSVIDAGGGAQLQNNGKLRYGSGGSINVSNTPLASSLAAGSEAADLRLDGELRAYSFNKGGTLKLSGAGFRISRQIGDAAAHMIYLAPEFFQRGGFNNYQLTSTHTGISIAPNTDVPLRPMNRVLAAQFATQASGADLNRLGDLTYLPADQQQAVSLGLKLERAKNVASTVDVKLESSASIHANPGASIALSSDTNLIIDGVIAAPAGDIQLKLNPPNKDNKDLEAINPSPKTIRLGPHGQLLAGAIYQATPDVTGRDQRLGTVRNGGTVGIAAAVDAQGYFIASPGSRIDVSGATQTLDIVRGTKTIATAVNGAAGTIDLSAAEGMVLNGDMLGAPGSAAGAAGGTLNVTLGTDNSSGTTIALTSATTTAPGLDEAPAATLKNKIQINPAKIKSGGFDAVALHSVGKITDPNALAQIKLEGDIDLKLNRSLVLDAPVLASNGGRAKLAAGYIKLGPVRSTVVPNLSLGQGSLILQGQHIDLVGTLGLSGFGPRTTNAAPLQFESTGDIRLIGGSQIENGVDGIFNKDRAGIFAAGRVNSVADIELHASQIYTATATDFILSVNRADANGQADGKITVRQNGATGAAPLSAASKLTLVAAEIEQLGTLRAPFGQIELNANKNLVLGETSVTSVAGAGQLVPFGKTEIGADWVYPLGAAQAIYTAAPEKSITLKAPNVSLAKGSVVDVSGGGDLLAREHQPGPGGTVDILGAAHAPGAFAIVPTNKNLFGSYDPYLNENSTVKTGTTIHLADGGPLLAGEYAMLPAGYAMLPGAYLITPLTTMSPTPGQSQQAYDGSRIVAGQRGAGGHNTLNKFQMVVICFD